MRWLLWFNQCIDIATHNPYLNLLITRFVCSTVSKRTVLRPYKANLRLQHVYQKGKLYQNFNQQIHYHQIGSRNNYCSRLGHKPMVYAIACLFIYSYGLSMDILGEYPSVIKRPLYHRVWKIVFIEPILWTRGSNWDPNCLSLASIWGPSQ